MCPTCVVWPESPLMSRLAIQTSSVGFGRTAAAAGRSVLTTLKTVALAPMPRPAIRMAKVAKPASRRSVRTRVAEVLKQVSERHGLTLDGLARAFV